MKTTRTYRYWRMPELKYLEENYQQLSHAAMAAHLGRPKAMVAQKLNDLGNLVGRGRPGCLRKKYRPRQKGGVAA